MEGSPGEGDKDAASHVKMIGKRRVWQRLPARQANSYLPFDYTFTDPLWFERPGADVSYLASLHPNSLVPKRDTYRIPTAPEMTAPAVEWRGWLINDTGANATAVSMPSMDYRIASVRWVAGRTSWISRIRYDILDVFALMA